jgi:glycosyltransferase involved in cell wall biosynthesis
MQVETTEVSDGGERAAVTIITPTKNRLPLLCKAIDSIKAQHFASWEHIVVDDGSDDGTAAEVERQSRTNPRIRLLRRTGDRTGANVCRNLGLRESTAELIVFLDSDDLLRSHCLGRRVQIMHRNVDLDFAIFNGAVFKNVRGDLGNRVDYDHLGDDFTRFLAFECPWVISGPIWRKQVLLRIGAFDESLLSWQDVELHIRAIASGCKYLRFSEIDHDIRWQSDSEKVSVKQGRSLRHLEAAPSVFAKFEKTVRDGPGMNWNRKRALCGLYFSAAELMLAAGAAGHARASWKLARHRGLAGKALYLQGAILLALMSLGGLGARIGARLSHKWKGIVRFRTIPELVG